MSPHLTPEQFVDALERPLPAQRQAHLAVCAACSAELAEMRLLMGDVTIAGTVPEPSPLFWDHLSARVREAVDAVTEPLPWWRTGWRPVAAMVGVLGVVALAVIARPSRVAPVPATASVEVSAAERAEIAESDSFWEMISAVAPSLGFDDARAAGMAPGRAATDAAIESLTPAERQELMRLLRAEMGASE